MKTRSIVTAVLLSLFTSPLTAEATAAASSSSSLDIMEVFAAAPVIYTILLILSVASCSIWLYSLLTLKPSSMVPSDFINQMRELLAEKHFELALDRCQNENNFCSQIIASGIAARHHGPQVMMDAMQSEGRRSGNSLWQRISLLNEIAAIAPMLGLLGTVLGLFFAFYDANRSPESITTMFDGLGIAVGTTVAGLIVAILSMIFYSSLKYRVVVLLNMVENEVLGLVNLVEQDELVPITPSTGKSS